MLAFEILGSLLVLAALVCFEREYREAGLLLQLVACVVWALFAGANGLWGLMGLQIVLFLVAFGGLWRKTR